MRHERTFVRPDTYSRWHRGLDDHLTAIDIDWVEYCNVCREPLAVVETALDLGTGKTATITKIVAQRLDIPAFLVLYRVADDDDGEYIHSMRVGRLHPPSDGGMVEISPEIWAQRLHRLRDEHECGR